MEIKAHPFNSLGEYIYADIISFYNGQWIFSKHKERTTGTGKKSGVSETNGFPQENY